MSYKSSYKIELPNKEPFSTFEVGCVLQEVTKYFVSNNIGINQVDQNNKVNWSDWRASLKKDGFLKVTNVDKNVTVTVTEEKED